MAADEMLDAGPRARILAWRRDHGKLELQHEAVKNALAAEEREQSQRLFSALRATLSEHLKIEEELAFPEVEKRIPDGTEPIRSLRIAHVSYRQDLEEIGRQIERGHLQAAGAIFNAFIESFTTHERLESQLLDLLK